METSARQTYLDWLRILSIVGVLFFHSAMPYVTGDWWHIKNHETSNLLMESNYFMHLFRMPLLFFISGTVSYFMMQRRSSISFIGLRFRRLFIPLLVGMFFIVPPQIYMERLNNGYTGGIWNFYKTVFNFVPYPKGSFSWHHLWFIAYLFLYDILFAPLFAWMASPKSILLKEKLALLAKGKWLYILMIPGIIWYALLAAKFPETNDLAHDYCYFVYWLFFLLAGFICITQPLLMDSLERNRRFALTIGFVCLIFLNCLRWNKIEPGEAQWPFGGYSLVELFLALKAIVAWSWVLALVGYGKKYMNRKHKVLDYLNQAVYPFYILHQTVIVILTYYIVQTQNESILSKYIYTVGFTFFITVGIYHLLVRPFALTRFLFGMKPKTKKKVATFPETEKSGEVAMLSA
ncbi:acyltransferase family protein [Mucilaginibacter gotjawali]|uniref:Glucans biosynthesis protein C n=2 Tax=Mucilaginibacter gotjawali TaxID=1550579 RepID=A0A120MYU4_9SPHI|nr:acyltransferase family protein [Mucilaginibacter gotjawali]MBB3058688.1 peptidoglycan/LPS O-acetylase OafA/YrhL [Mucilaginibacter gotjawali]BAU55842.1 Glucans biosynthesis protein C [Mucilaginibacter gotjawali]